jgi:hypothetical protein
MRHLYCILLLLLTAHALSAAPPMLTYVYPAGGQRGTKVDVTLGGTFPTWPVAAWTDGRGVEATAAKESGKLTLTIAADAEPGTHWLRVHTAEGASVVRPFVVGTLPEVSEKEPNDDPRKPQELPGNAIVNGRLDKNEDVDVFALRLRKGQTLVAALDANRTLKSPMDGVLQVVSADGFVLDQNNDFHGLDPLVAFDVPKDGTYLVRVFAFPAVPDASIRLAGKDTFIYRLTVTTGGYVDHPFPLAVARSNPGAVELIGWNLPEALRRLPVKLNGGGDAVLHHPDLANTARVRVEDNPVGTCAPDTSHDKPQPLALPSVVSGRLGVAERSDWYAFPGKKGQKLAFRVEGRTLGFPIDPVLRLTDSGGKLLAEAQAKALDGDPTFDFTVPQDGRYTLEVRDLHEEGSRRHVYLLRAGEVTPDFTLKVAADRFVQTPGKPLDIPVTVDRVAGFAGLIELTVEGVPADAVTALPADAKAKALTLRLAARDGPFSGPLRIVGRSAKGPARIAQAPLTELGITSEHLWLTIAPAMKK